MIDIDRLDDKFLEVFQDSESEVLRKFFSPGRINLIGEHTDYNGGYVFPAAITQGTYGMARIRDDRLLRFFSLNFIETGIIEIHLDDLNTCADHAWANYPKGMIRLIQESGNDLPSGMDVLIYGDLPHGAGLSSSASLEILTGMMVNALFDLRLERLDLVKIGHQVENEFIGVNSGIMDQFIVAMGKKDHGILLDSRHLQYEYVPLLQMGYKIVIMNTNKQRTLADSKYNQRKEECEAALQDLKKGIDINSLADLSPAMFEEHKLLIRDEVLAKRVRHVVYENERTLKAAEALKNNDVVAFGRFMNASHQSLRDDYEVTGSELNTLVEAAWKQDGTLGARMTGAGFGGCAIALVKEDMVESFILNVGKEYKEKIGYAADFYIASIGDGAKEI